MKPLKSIILYIWQLPQNLAGIILFHIPKYKIMREIEYRGRRVAVCENFPGGISLGNYILVDYNRQNPDGYAERMALSYSIRHEYGHSRQSLYLGWFYLPVIGGASGGRCVIRKLRRMLGKVVGCYYTFWPERWANNLGGIPEYGLT